MKISYQWLREYLPENETTIPYISDVEKIAEILTSVGLEVEAVEPFSSLPGNLEGLVVGEVLTCEKHPNADKLKLTTVAINDKDTLQIVCGAPNVEAGQKVIVATPNTKLFPLSGEPFIIKKAKIRGIESNGMICAEDEIGLGESHAGIMVLPPETQTGMPAAKYFGIYTDTIFEIGLTPNRMDAQSHMGVAKDVCAWISHHTKKEVKIISPLGRPLSKEDDSLDIEVEVKDASLCKRYSGVSISGISITESPAWIQNKLKAIGIRPINNIVDITNFILHATGQPLHAFDADKITGKKVIVETLPEKSSFITLDEKKRSLFKDDIMICDGGENPMCIAGVFGGMESGVTDSTTNIFLESAVFNGANIRKSIFNHGLRTDAAVRFEKGVDISKTVDVLKYAALLIKEIAGGKISSSVKDIYMPPKPRTIKLTFDYLKKLSGKDFDSSDVQNILKSLGFIIKTVENSFIEVQAPESNPDITLPADLVEEILRIDGLDNISIPAEVKMTPGIHDHSRELLLKERIISWLIGNGFSEIFTNSLTSDQYFSKEELSSAVHIINSLSEELTIMRPQILPTGLESIAFNINRQNRDLFLFEFGKTYHEKSPGDYVEKDHLALFFTGDVVQKSWNKKATVVDLYYVKGVANALFSIAGFAGVQEKVLSHGHLKNAISFSSKKEIAYAGEIKKETLQSFGIKQPVYYLDIDWKQLQLNAMKMKTVYEPVVKFPTVTRDLSMVVDKNLPYSEINDLVKSLHLKKLQRIHLFDLYENEKLGKDKKSIAMNFSFSDPQKTLTDKETDGMMRMIMNSLHENLNAEIRSNA